MPSIIKNGVNYTNSELLSTLSDTNISSPANGEALVYDSVNQKWINGEAGGKVWQGTQAQYDAITNPDPDTTYFITDGQQVTSNMWEGTAAEYAQITDPDPATFYFIKDGDSVSCNLGELNDVTVSSPSAGQVLTRNSSNNGWEAKGLLPSGYFIKEYNGTMPTTQTNKYEEIETGVSSALLLGATVYDNSNSRYEPLPLGVNEASTIYNAHSTFFLNTAGSLNWRVFINSSAGVTKYGGQTVKFIFAVKK